MKLPDFKTALKAGVADVENLFSSAPPEMRTDLTAAAVTGVARLRELAETDIEKEADKIVPGAYTAQTNAVIAEGLELLAAKAQAELTAKAAAIEAAQAEVAQAQVAAQSAGAAS